MKQYVMVVQSQAKQGRDDEYNHWYDTVHLPDILAIPGVKAGRRFEATPVGIGPAGLRYLAIFDIEAEDPGQVLAEMAKRSAEGRMAGTDALDAPASVLWFYEVVDGR